jgi:hypothetical protein
MSFTLQSIYRAFFRSSLVSNITARLSVSFIKWSIFPPVEKQNIKFGGGVTDLKNGTLFVYP